MTPVFQKLEALEENRRPFGTQLFPFRTMAMILSFISLVIVSRIMVWLFRTGRLRKDQDYFMCIVNIDDNGSDVSIEASKTTSLYLNVAQYVPVSRAASPVSASVSQLVYSWMLFRCIGFVSVVCIQFNSGPNRLNSTLLCCAADIYYFLQLTLLFTNEQHSINFYSKVV